MPLGRNTSSGPQRYRCQNKNRSTRDLLQGMLMRGKKEEAGRGRKICQNIANYDHCNSEKRMKRLDRKDLRLQQVFKKVLDRLMGSP